MNDISIRVEDLGKRYRVRSSPERYRTLRDVVANSLTAPGRILRSVWAGPDAVGSRHYQDMWALKDVSFEVGRGEVVGIVGRNGAGKSTLLKILSRITHPTEGAADVYGRVGSLLEVGTGFHPELSGRENIYLNGAILGMKRTEIDDAFEQIVEFAEVEKFIDTPVKHYSSGMGLRLGFAVAAHLEPDTLLVDEVLAVGDYTFQNKCIGRLSQLTDSHKTVFLVSHNLAVIRNLATRTIWLDRGQVMLDGETQEVVSAYLANSAHMHLGERVSLREHANRLRGCPELMKEIRLSGDASSGGVFPMGSTIRISVDFDSPKPLTRPYLGIGIEDEDGQRVYSINTKISNGYIPDSASSGTFTCELVDIPLHQRIFSITLTLHEGSHKADRIDRACRFQVGPRDVYGSGHLSPPGQGYFFWPANWNFTPSNEPAETLVETAR